MRGSSTAAATAALRLGAALFALLAASGCAAPGVVSDCSVRFDDKHRLVATATVRNRSTRVVERTVVLVTATMFHPPENRLFASSSRIGGRQSETIHARVVDDIKYDFKFATNGCELDSLFYEDGSYWEAPSPL